MDTNLIQKIDYYVTEALKKGYVPDEYSEWTLRAFEFASLGEEGRDPFHRISSTSSKYDFNTCNNKFSECLKNHNGQRNEVSFYRHCTDRLQIVPFSKVHRTESTFKAANTSSTQEGTVMKWRDFVISKEPPEEIPLNKIGEAPIATSGNHSLVIGKKKSRKSLFLVLWLTLYLRINPKSDLSEILIFDTEQGTRHVWKVMDSIPNDWL